MKRKLNKKGKIALICLFLVLISIISIIFIKADNVTENHILESTDRYDLKIDYPNFTNKKIEEKVMAYIDKQKQEFMNVVENSKNIEISSKYDFNLNVTSSERNNITYVNILTYSYTGGAHYIRDDYSLYWDDDTKEFVDLKFFFTDEETFKEMANLAYYYVLNLGKEENRNFDQLWVKRGTAPTIDNYRHFKFTDNGLEIMFPPYQVASWADGQINITIPYEDINKYLKQEYRDTTKDETVVKEMPQIRDLSQFKDKKLIAFTFDDGPSTNNTNLLLDNLDKYNARVTFFVLGSRVDSNKEVIKRAYLQGNDIGSHTYNHRNLNLLNDAEIIAEVSKTNEKVKEIIGIYPTLLRPPYGNLTNHSKELVNMNIILWDIDPLDWKYKKKNRVAEEIIEHAHDGAIILLHDIYKSSVEGALLAMEELEKQGYAFVTITEMAQLRGIDLDYQTSYFNMKK